MQTYVDTLVRKIEEMRIEMIELAHQYGYTNPNVLQCSQALDELIHSYQITK
ncbi:Spo0E family sporulation regulatory protein-aspartic acid phosphatase [Neobacillus sp. D3-1R]|uniref:Spo0E family sporulation regulatory protein-aspartic acid phosphatase n=1 Tax=Neobacillus sp. D3-1R TaxID=3445778 RepID=UPI003F9F283E